MDWRNIIERAAWSALWGFLNSFPVAQLAAAMTDGTLSGMNQLLLAGAGGAMTALMSTMKTIAQERIGMGPGVE